MIFIYMGKVIREICLQSMGFGSFLLFRKGKKKSKSGSQAGHRKVRSTQLVCRHRGSQHSLAAPRTAGSKSDIYIVAITADRLWLPASDHLHIQQARLR